MPVSPNFIKHLTVWFHYETWSLEEALQLFSEILPESGPDISWLYQKSDSGLPSGAIIRDAVFTIPAPREGDYIEVSMRNNTSARAEVWNRRVDQAQETLHDLLQHWTRRADIEREENLYDRYPARYFITWIEKNNLKHMITWWDTVNENGFLEKIKGYNDEDYFFKEENIHSPLQNQQSDNKRYVGWKQITAAWVSYGQKEVGDRQIKNYAKQGLEIIHIEKGRKKIPTCTDKAIRNFIYAREMKKNQKK